MAGECLYKVEKLKTATAKAGLIKLGKGESMETFQRKFQSQLGTLYLVASAGGLHGIFWKAQKLPQVRPGTSAAEMLDRAEREIAEYLRGRRKQFDVPIQLEGTEFQKRVWAALRKIPYGQTRSYRDIARALRNPNACRAVGSANGKNPVALIVPCHRVINESGKLGGYAGGLSIKKKLLSLEMTGRLG